MNKQLFCVFIILFVSPNKVIVVIRLSHMRKIPMFMNEHYYIIDSYGIILQYFCARGQLNMFRQFRSTGE